MKEIVIGCDSAAVELKKHIIEVLDQDGVVWEDVGVHSSDDERMYPLVARDVVEKVIASEFKKHGILLCGTGIGMAIAANKFSGIYAAVCHDIYSAERARLSNNTNVITLGARVIGTELAKMIVRKWLSLEFVPGSSSPKIAQITEFECANFKKDQSVIPTI